MNSKNYLLPLLIAVAMFSAVNVKGQFEKIYPTTHDCVFRDVIRVADGTYFLCGWVATSEITDTDAMICHVDNVGNEMDGWPKYYGTNGKNKQDFFYSLVETPDGNFLALGYSWSYSTATQTYSDIYLMKFKPNGDEIFHKTFGSYGFDEGRRILKTKDGNFIIVGTTTNGSDQQAFLMKIDQNGVPLWSPAMQMYGNSNMEYGLCVQECSDGSFLMSGQTTSLDPRGDAYFVKTNSSGGRIWEQIYGEPLDDEATAIQVNSDDSFVAAIRDSTAAPPVGSDINVRIRKFDANGAAVPGYNRSFGGQSKDTPKSIHVANDGNYYVGAISRSWNWRGNSDNDSPDMWLLKINSATGDTIWSRNFGGPHHDHCEEAIQDPQEDAILLCGHSVQYPYMFHPYFIKTNALGRVAPIGIKENEFAAGTTVFPNPAAGVMFIKSENYISNVQIRVTNAIGQTVLLQSNIELQGAEERKLDLTDMKAGVYSVSVESGNLRRIEKVVIQ